MTPGENGPRGAWIPRQGTPLAHEPEIGSKRHVASEAPWGQDLHGRQGKDWQG
jgi:hypothetical protein